MRPLTVFVGPSLSVDDARSLAQDAAILGPARCGDVFSAAERAPGSTIVLIDGLYGHVPAVWHKEILAALALGCRVVGGGSMGALRASECDRFGMEGVGRVYRAYATGLVSDDAEVALAHLGGTAGYRGLTVPLIEIRFLLDDWSDRVGPELASDLFTAASDIYFMDRTFEAVSGAFYDVSRSSVVGELLSVLRRGPSVKGMDARLAIATAMDSASTFPPEPRVRVESTAQWRRAEREFRHPESSVCLDPQDPRLDEVQFLRRALLDATDEQHGLKARLYQELVVEAAARLGIVVGIDEVQSESVRRRCELGLRSAAATEEWLNDQGLTVRQWQQALAYELVEDKLVDTYAENLRGQLPLALMREGAWCPSCTPEFSGSIPDSFEAIARELARLGLGRYVVDTDLEDAALRLGFASADELMTTLEVLDDNYL